MENIGNQLHNLLYEMLVAQMELKSIICLRVILYVIPSGKFSKRNIYNVFYLHMYNVCKLIVEDIHNFEHNYLKPMQPTYMYKYIHILTAYK